MRKKRLIITSLISIVLVSVLMIGSTYSIFTSSDVDEELNVYETGNLNITYTASSDNITISNSLPTTLEESIKITPYRVTVTNNGTVPYMFDMILDTTTATDQIDSQYIMTQVGKIEAKSLGSCTDNIIKEDIILPANSSVDIDIRVWISDMVQNTEIDKSFVAKLRIDGIAVYDDNQEIDNSILVADLYETLSSKIMNLYHDGSELTTVNIGGDSSNPSVTQNSKQGLMLDNNGEYRYYGASPDNYIEFNGELWRIISVSNVKSDEEDTEGSMRVKIIRDESIGNYSWDSSDSSINTGYGVNDWSKADLMIELNDLYYNQKTGTCYNGQSNASVACNFVNIGLNQESKNLISDALWYLGGSAVSENLYANDYYNFERGTIVYDCSTDDGACSRATNWTGKVGLMYPSDYMYATDLDVCLSTNYNETNSNQDYTNVNCKDNDWLYNSAVRQWSLSSYAGDANRVICVYLGGHVSVSGYVEGNYGAALALAVRPTVYLRSDVMFYGGMGTKENPYKVTVDHDLLSSHVVDLYHDGSELKTVNIGGSSANPSVSQNSKQSIMLDNNGEYRYYGASPNNYVEFNDELWRIISVSNVKSNEDDLVGSMRVKIIRSEGIDYFSWDSSASTINSGYGVNDWTQADLMTELNTLYLNQESGICYNDVNDGSNECDFTSIGLDVESRNMVGDALYYLGAFNIDAAAVRYANHYYDGERSINVYSGNPTSWLGKIALMYPSDYAYATDLNICTNAVGWGGTTDGYNQNSSCIDNDWLLYGESWSHAEWTITPFNDRGTNAFHVNGVGYISGQTVAYPQLFRPTVYLRSDVMFYGGMGTKENPYQISIS